MRAILLSLSLLLSVNAMADAWYTQTDGNLGANHQAKCGLNLTCSKSNGRVTLTKSPIVAVSADTAATKAQCGATFYNSAAGIVTLPEASTVLGCEYTFVVGSVTNLGVNPADATDRIYILTNANGDSIIADAIGESIKIKAVGNDVWAVIGTAYGTWTDSN